MELPHDTFPRPKPSHKSVMLNSPAATAFRTWVKSHPARLLGCHGFWNKNKNSRQPPNLCHRFRWWVPPEFHHTLFCHGFWELMFSQMFNSLHFTTFRSHRSGESLISFRSFISQLFKPHIIQLPQSFINSMIFAYPQSKTHAKTPTATNPHPTTLKDRKPKRK